MKEVNDLIKALEVGTYPSQLSQGGPLLVEDLDVTLKMATFDFPRHWTLGQFNRLLKNLEKRNIEHSSIFRNAKFQLGFWNRKIIIGEQEYKFAVR